MHCPRCGKAFNIGQESCRNCGIRLDDSLFRKYSSFPTPYDIKGGRYKVLVAILLVGIFSIVVLVITPIFGLLMSAFISLAGTEFVYEDILAVNRVRRNKALDPVGWSIFTFFLWIVAIPWYLFSKRRIALGLVRGVPSQ